jgi:hypothetical protein
MAFDVSHRFWYFFGFHWVLGIFLNSSLRTSVSHWFLSSVLFSFPVFEYCLGILLLLLLISSLLPLWSDMMLGVISIFLNLFRLALCPKIWCILERVPWAMEKNVYCLAVRWNTLSTISIWSNVCSSYKISLFFFSLDDLSIDDSGVFRSLTITVLVSICALRTIAILFYVDGCLCLVHIG